MLFFTVNLSAQEGLRISDVFQYYGKKHGSTMVQLSSDVLSSYNMTLYISLSFHPSTKGNKGLDWVTNCIDQDKKRAKKLKRQCWTENYNPVISNYHKYKKVRTDSSFSKLIKSKKRHLSI